MSAERSSQLLLGQLTVKRDAFRLHLDSAIQLDRVTAVFGASGSGKSTLLRSVAGLLEPDAGRIQCRNTTWFDHDQGIHLPAQARPIGTLFQDSRLFSHRTVAGNLQLAMRFARKRSAASTRTPDYDGVVAALDLGPLLKRHPASLSGGEARRAALARTLLARPSLLLLDEPLTGLDNERKAEILPYLTRVFAEYGLPTLYVSHDIDEVAQLADDMLVLDQGQLRLSGSVAEMIEALALTAYTGRFEAGALINGTVTGHDERLHLTQVDLNGQSLTLPMQSRLAPKSPVRLRIRARDVAIAINEPAGLSIRNVLPGTLLALTPEPEPGFVDALVQVGEARIRARLTLAAVEELNLSESQRVFVLIKSVSFAGD
ncbi:MAG: molybdenum ABC transporter ATP-binding protein [Pseudomonadales bacterium]